MAHVSRPSVPECDTFICCNFRVQQDFIVILCIIGWHVDCYSDILSIEAND